VRLTRLELYRAKLASSYDHDLRVDARAVSENSPARSPAPFQDLRLKTICNAGSQCVPDRSIRVPGGEAKCLPSTRPSMLSWATRVNFPAPCAISLYSAPWTRGPQEVYGCCTWGWGKPLVACHLACCMPMKQVTPQDFRPSSKFLVLLRYS
jgi:hypothetical protein